MLPKSPDVKILDDSEIAEDKMDLDHIAEHLGGSVTPGGSVTFGKLTLIPPPSNTEDGEDGWCTTLILDLRGQGSAIFMSGIEDVDRVLFRTYILEHREHGKSEVRELVLESKTGSLYISLEGNEYTISAILKQRKSKGGGVDEI